VPNTRSSGFRRICGYISETVIDRAIFTMEDEYKVILVCALSSSAAFDDLEWPQTPASRSQYRWISRKQCMYGQIYQVLMRLGILCPKTTTFANDTNVALSLSNSWASCLWLASETLCQWNFMSPPYHIVWPDS